MRNYDCVVVGSAAAHRTETAEIVGVEAVVCAIDGYEGRVGIGFDRLLRV